MKALVTCLFVFLMIVLLLVAGCADVSATQKVGDFGTAFGTSAEEQAAIDWFKATYGDPTTNNDQPARFIEPLITTGLSEKNLPTDKVTVFPVNGGSVYFFVIYDNFAKGDPITVSWTYLENGREVTRVQKEAGGDFGRFIVEFQKPDSGWGEGNQKITITGDGATAEVDFAIGDTLRTTPLPYDPDAPPATVSTTVPVTVAPTPSPTFTQPPVDFTLPITTPATTGTPTPTPTFTLPPDFTIPTTTHVPYTTFPTWTPTQTPTYTPTPMPNVDLGDIFSNFF
jgi:hypothetical protein